MPLGRVAVLPDEEPELVEPLLLADPEVPDELLVPDPVAPGPAVPADPAAPAPGVPDTFELVRIWLVAESQHWSPVAPLVPDPDVPVPVPVCAAATPIPATRSAAVETALNAVIFMVRSLDCCRGEPAATITTSSCSGRSIVRDRTLPLQRERSNAEGAAIEASAVRPLHFPDRQSGRCMPPVSASRRLLRAALRRRCANPRTG
jgi:hypothetical protein